MDKTKFCVDCIYCKKNWMRARVCIAPQNQYNLVTGNMIIPFCIENRRTYDIIHEVCGGSGAWFVPRRIYD